MVAVLHSCFECFPMRIWCLKAVVSHLVRVGTAAAAEQVIIINNIIIVIIGVRLRRTDHSAAAAVAALFFADLQPVSVVSRGRPSTAARAARATSSAAAAWKTSL
jgi:hypothetical protein